MLCIVSLMILLFRVCGILVIWMIFVGMWCGVVLVWMVWWMCLCSGLLSCMLLCRWMNSSICILFC